MVGVVAPDLCLFLLGTSRAQVSTYVASDQKQDDFYVTHSVSAASGVTGSGGPLFVYLAVGDSFTGDSYSSAGVCGL